MKIEDIPDGGSGVNGKEFVVSIISGVVSLVGVIYRESIGRGME
jgi:hypothetical protein